MLNKRSPRIASVGQFVNVATALAIVFLVSIGYFSALTDLPVII